MAETWQDMRRKYGSESNPKHEPNDEPSYDDSDSSDAYKRGYNAGYEDGFTAGESEGEEDTRSELDSDIETLESTIKDLEESLLDVIRLATEGADYEKIIREAAFYLREDQLPKPMQSKLTPEDVRTYWVRGKV